MWEITDLHHGVDEVFALLGCYATYVDICLLMLQTAYSSHFKDCLTLEDGTDMLS